MILSESENGTVIHSISYSTKSDCVSVINLVNKMRSVRVVTYLFIFSKCYAKAFSFEGMRIPDQFLINFSADIDKSKPAFAEKTNFKIKTYSFEAGLMQIASYLQKPKPACENNLSFENYNSHLYTLCNKIDEVRMELEKCLGLPPDDIHRISWCKGKLKFYQNMLTNGEKCLDLESIYCWSKVSMCELKIRCDDIFKKYMRYYYGSQKMKDENLISEDDEEVKQMCVMIKPVVNPFNIF